MAERPLPPMTALRRREENAVQSVDRAMDLLEALAFASEPIRLTDLAAQLGLHKSTVHRLAATLERRGYVEQDPQTGRYRMGLRLVEVGGAALSTLSVAKVGRPIMERLARQVGETVNIAVLQGTEVLYVDKVETDQSLIRMSVQIGKRSPVYCTAVGKVILAHNPELVPACLQGLQMRRLTPHTITTPEQFYEHLRHVANVSYAMDDEEHELGLRCVAVPVRDYMGRVVAALSVSGTTVRINRDRLTQLIPLLQGAGREISARMGYRGH